MQPGKAPLDPDLTAELSSAPAGSAASPQNATPATSATSDEKYRFRPSEFMLPGSVLAGRYEIIRVLGAGGMGAVYKARDRELDRIVAVKVIRPELTSDAEILLRFKQEIILARQITHRNVVRIFDLGEADGFKFITMEYIEGEDLASRLALRKKLSAEEATGVIRQVCLALESAHREGVIHRDLKPQNIMIDQQGRVVVMDFGVARTFAGTGLTQTDVVVGTLEYMSPEQAQGGDIDQRSDLFAAGLIFYELLTGERPYKAETPVASLVKRLEQPCPPISDLGHAFSPELTAIVSKCLERDRQLRYQSAREIINDLEAQQGLPPVRTVRPWLRSHGLQICAVLVVVAIVATALKTWNRSVQLWQKQRVPAQVTREIRPTSASNVAMAEYKDAEELIREGRNLDALSHLSKAVADDPNFALAHSRLAEVYAILGRDRAAQSSSDRALNVGVNLPLPEKELIQAEHAVIIKDFPKAVDLYEHLVKTFPGNSDLQYALADAYENNGAFDKAQTSYAKVLQSEAHETRVLLAIGRVDIKMDNPSEGLEPLSHAFTQAMLANNYEQQAMILQALGIAYAQLNRNDDALRSYQQSFETKRRLGDSKGMADSLEQIAQLYDGWGKSELALKNYQHALQIRRQLGDSAGTANVLLDLGQFYHDRGKYDQALKLFRASLALQRTVGNGSNEALCLNNIGNSYLGKGDYANARAYFNRSLQLRETFKVPTDIAQTLHNLAETSADTGNYDKAIADYLRALDFRRAAGDKEGVAVETESLGTLFGYQGRLGAALSAHEDALKTFRELQDQSFWLPAALADYGHALAQVGRIDEARKTLDQAAALAQTAKNNVLLAQAIDFQGEAALCAGDLNAARRLFQKALRIADKTTDQHLQLLVRVNLARAAVGRPADSTFIRRLHALSVQADGMGQMYLSVECLIALGRALFEEKHYPLAEQELLLATRRSDKLGSKFLSAESHFLLANALHQTGRNAEAGQHYRATLQFLDGIHAEPGSTTVLQRSDVNSMYSAATHALQAN